jgi:hypothetical protein
LEDEMLFILAMLGGFLTGTFATTWRRVGTAVLWIAALTTVLFFVSPDFHTLTTQSPLFLNTHGSTERAGLMALTAVLGFLSFAGCAAFWAVPILALRRWSRRLSQA